MSELFLQIVNMSISAGWVALAVMWARFLLKKGKAPKWVTVALWSIVGVRLVCPISIESSLSLLPSAKTLPNQIITNDTFSIQSGISTVDNRVNDYLGSQYYEGVTASNGLGGNILTVLSVIWIVGIAALLIYAIFSYVRLRRKVGTAVLLRDNIFESENVTSPFVLGVIKPKIYLPFNMSEQQSEYVIAHEKTHIRRKDNLWKPLGFLLLTLHWFNPLVWLGYILLCRDIELACDEKVVKELDNVERADYSQTLLNLSVSNRIVSVCPLAFGEVGVKDRVKSILNYKKPAFWIIIIAVVLCVAVAVCFLTNPASKNDIYSIENWEWNYSLTMDKSTGEVVAQAPTASTYLGENVKTEMFDMRAKNGKMTVKNILNNETYNLKYREKSRTANGIIYNIYGDKKGTAVIDFKKSVNSVEISIDNLVFVFVANRTKEPVTVTSMGSSSDGIGIMLKDYNLTDENPYFTVEWRNDTDEEFVYGEAFYILKKSSFGDKYKSCTKKTMEFNVIGIILPPHSTQIKKYDLTDFNLSKKGEYRFTTALGEEQGQWFNFEINDVSTATAIIGGADGPQGVSVKRIF